MGGGQQKMGQSLPVEKRNTLWRGSAAGLKKKKVKQTQNLRVGKEARERPSGTGTLSWAPWAVLSRQHVNCTRALVCVCVCVCTHRDLTGSTEGIRKSLAHF